MSFILYNGKPKLYFTFQTAGKNPKHGMFFLKKIIKAICADFLKHFKVTANSPV